MDELTRDERADRLAVIAAGLTARIRDDDPAATHRWLREQMAGEDWCALAVVLACAVPVDRTWRELTAWTLGDSTVIAERRRVLDEALRPRRAA